MTSIICRCSSRSIYKMMRSSYSNLVNQRLLSGSQSCSYTNSVKEKDTEVSEDSSKKIEVGEPVSVESPAVEEIFSKMKILKKEKEDFKDKYQRTLADRENVRKRLEKQVIDAKDFGIQSFCKDLLEVSDIFRKAIESVPKEEISKETQLFNDLYDGVVMTENQLLTVFRRHGLKQIIPKEGEKFNPAEEEAMFEVPQEEGKSPGTIVHVLRTGWNLKDRCVRSAQVSVVKS